MIILCKQSVFLGRANAILSKTSVMTAKLDKIHEMYKLLNEKERVNHDIMSTFGRFGLSQTLRRLGLEKQQGVSALQLIISL